MMVSSIQLGTPERLPTSAVATSWTICRILAVHSLMRRVFFEGTRYICPRAGMFSTNMAERSPVWVPVANSVGLWLPPMTKLLCPKNSLSGRVSR